VAPSPGGQVSVVHPGSPAQVAGLCPGDVVVSINGHALRDVIDYRFYSANEELDLVIRRGALAPFSVHIERDYGQDIGLEFAAPTFDGIRRCRNRCDFCFIHQMPPGLRASLYVKDDDYRYSFLFGNFITLTNLDESDWSRLAEQRLSPLYISVHASDRELRSRILGTPAIPDVLAQIERLGRLGIEVHAQIVVIPGLNDGRAMEDTVNDLAALHPTVASIAVVPVGLTRYHSCGLRPPTPDEARAILAFAGPLQRHFRQRWGIALLYPSDEWYLTAGLPVPAARAYNGFPQLANGVGLVRQLLDDWQRTRQRGLKRPWPYGKVTWVCGTLIAPVLRQLAQELAALVQGTIEVVPVENAFFGPTVTVSGLLTAQDVIESLRGHTLGDRLVLPRAMLDASGEVTLDDYGQADIENALGVPVLLAERLSELLA
jgi:putative radical SAM enzyme (TIGR03279 family)